MKSNRIVLFVALISFALIAAGCTQAPTYNDYYVSVLGSNSTGNGSQSKPWRTIQYALDHASYSGFDKTRINLAKGIYNENIVIQKPVIITGAGSSETVSSNAGNPDLPNQQVSVISRQIPANLAPDDTVKSVDVNGAGEVTLENLNVFGGGVTSYDSDFSMQNVIVNGVTGFYGVKVDHSSFSILNSKIVTQGGYYSDYGLFILASAGFFTNSYAGKGFDHVINIEPWADSDKVDQNNLPTPINIYITGATIEGSTVYYADGIAIRGPANVIIKNSKITRTGGEPSNKGAP